MICAKSLSAYTSAHHQHNNNAAHRFMPAADYSTVNKMSHMRRKQISFAVGSANFNYIINHQ